MFKILGKISEIKDKAREIKEKLRFIEVIYESEDKAIKIYASADKQIRKIEFNDNLLGNKLNLEERIVEEVNAAIAKCDAKGKEYTKEELKDSIPNIPGLDVGSFFS